MSKRVLGRGLDALIPEQPTSPAATGPQIIQVPLDRVAPNPEQPRKAFDESAIADLARSIEEYGILEPVIVSPRAEGFILLAGERRVLAARKAGLETVPAIVRDGDPEDMLAVALIENLQREDLNAMEEAHAYRRLRDEFGLTQEEVAERVGKSRVSVANALRLLQLPAEIRDDVSRGTLSAGHARAILSVESPEGRLRLWREITDGGLSVRGAEQAARKLSSPRVRVRSRGQGTVRGADPQIRHLEDQLRQSLATQVKIVPATKGGRIEVTYYGDTDLERLLGLMGVADIS